MSQGLLEYRKRTGRQSQAGAQEMPVYPEPALSRAAPRVVNVHVTDVRVVNSSNRRRVAGEASVGRSAKEAALSSSPRSRHGYATM